MSDHLPFMSPSPWALSSRRNATIENAYFDANFFGDDVTYTSNQRIMEAHTDKFEHMYSLTAGEKSEMTDEWVKVVNAVYGKVQMNISTAGGWTGFYIVKLGRYVPGNVRLGYTTNTKDFSVLYDGCRGFLWDYWTNSNSSDQHNYQIAERPTMGSANNGAIYISVDRNNTNKWRLWVVDGDGNTTTYYLAGVPTTEGDSCAVQWEFVKGSHVIVKLYHLNANAQKFDDFELPTWPIAETGYYAKKVMTASPVNEFVPSSPLVSSGSAVESSNGSIGRFAFELRGIGNDWEYLV